MNKFTTTAWAANGRDTVTVEGPVCPGALDEGLERKPSSNKGMENAYSDGNIDPDRYAIVPVEPLNVVLNAAEFGSMEQSPPGCWDEQIDEVRAMLQAHKEEG